MRNLLVLFAVVFFYSVGFAQNAPQSTQGSTLTPNPGISFTLPAGSWVNIPAEQSLVPFIMERKILEQIETQYKVSVVYQTVGGYTDVPSLFDQVMDVFSANWAGLKTVQPLKLISPIYSVSGPRKFSAVYQLMDVLTSTPFRLEVVVVSPFDMRGNKGVLMILCPEDRYYDARFLIAGIRNSLALDEKAATNAPGRNSQMPSQQQ